MSLAFIALGCHKPSDGCHKIDNTHLIGSFGVLAVACVSSSWVFANSCSCDLWEMHHKATLAVMAVPFTMVTMVAVVFPLMLGVGDTCFAHSPEEDQIFLGISRLETVLMLAAGMGVSWAAVSTSAVWLCHMPSKAAVGKIGVGYAVVASILNTLGIMAFIGHGCTAGHFTWVFLRLGIFMSTAVLHRLMICMTEAHSAMGYHIRMRKAFAWEMVAGSAQLLAFLAQVTDIRLGTLSAVVYTLGSLGLVVCSGIISWHAWRALQEALKAVELAMPCLPSTTGGAMEIAATWCCT